MNIINIEHIAKIYQVGSEEVHALRDVSLKIDKNEYVAIMGPSGSGKSTLMNMLGCLDTPTKGIYDFKGNNVSQMNDNELATIRNKEIGFVFQTFNLLARSNALHNVELPLIYAGVSSSERKERARLALDQVGLSDRIHHKPNELSGGQHQGCARKARSHGRSLGHNDGNEYGKDTSGAKNFGNAGQGRGRTAITGLRLLAPECVR